jgi:hypothetical protein
MSGSLMRRDQGCLMQVFLRIPICYWMIIWARGGWTRGCATRYSNASAWSRIGIGYLLRTFLMALEVASYVGSGQGLMYDCDIRCGSIECGRKVQIFKSVRDTRHPLTWDAKDTNY